MPYKFETNKIKLNPLDDRRRKLTDEDKKEIKYLYMKNIGGIYHSQRYLARRYNVSRRLIIFIGDEEKLKIHKENCKKRGWKKYYDTEKRRIVQKEHRDYKKGIMN